MSTAQPIPAGEPVLALACGDNYIYICASDQRSAFVVDPSEADMVLDTLAQRGLTLATVLVTHHHGDHTGGISTLKSKTDCQVVAPASSGVRRCDLGVSNGDELTIGNLRVSVLATPGHTRTSVCYYMPPQSGQSGAVWTGDTLFVGGCGRPMECDPAILWESLVKLAALPDETLVYCGHNYTAENYEFALTIEPDNQAVRERLRETRLADSARRPTVPSSIAQEKATNVFLRGGEATVKEALGMNEASPAEVFAELRRRKNRFG